MEVQTAEDLADYLSGCGINLSQWGKGEAKNVDCLFRELASKEATLERHHGRLYRFSQGATVNVYYTLPTGEKLWLKEAFQTFNDRPGQRKKRNLPTSIGEKRPPDELPEAAARRALEEELGIRVPLELRLIDIRQKGPRESVAYPGILTVDVYEVYETDLPDDCYCSEGYTERQERKSTCFVWVSAAEQAGIIDTAVSIMPALQT